MKIEKNVPIPVDRKKALREQLNGLVKQMKVGDSVVATKEERTILASSWEVIFYFKKLDGKEQLTRCWLLAKRDESLKSESWYNAREELRNAADKPLDMLPILMGKNAYLDRYIEYRMKNGV